ncbi:MAG: phosphotransferase [Micavibrio sp.]|nr:phosphotransferase [Micavibrio sp.]
MMLTNAFDEDALRLFLQKHDCNNIASLGGDTSIRRYYRARCNKRSVIVMESVPDHSPLMSRGHKMSDFIRLSKWLNENGLNAPEVYDADESHGYMLLEDFGDLSIKGALAQGVDAKVLYEAANDVLQHIASLDNAPILPNYYQSRVHESRDCILKFYFPNLLREHKDASDAYFAAWAEVEKPLPAPSETFQHIDFHAENLMWNEGVSGIKRIGILDFQGAMIGPAPYDLANLLEDARQYVPLDIRQNILSNYDEDFQSWYRVLATQFHCRVIGQFIKIAQENGRTEYLSHIPRLENYIIEALKDPILKPLKEFFDHFGLDFSSPKAFNAPNYKD